MLQVVTMIYTFNFGRQILLFGSRPETINLLVHQELMTERLLLRVQKVTNIYYTHKEKKN